MPLNHTGGKDYGFQATIHNFTVMVSWSHSEEVFSPIMQKPAEAVISDVCARFGVAEKPFASHLLIYAMGIAPAIHCKNFFNNNF